MTEQAKPVDSHHPLKAWFDSSFHRSGEASDVAANVLARSRNFLLRHYRTKSPFLTDYKVCMRFENLGDNCEVGLMQRHFGAEPLGLLRFSAIGIEDLIVAVKDDFAGVGDPDQTRLCVSPTNGEYFVIDQKYNINSHGLIFSANIRPEKAHGDICRRAKFLRNKLLEDMASGAKIFIYKSEADTPVALVRDLHAALRRHGPTQLLWVRPSSDASLQGDVQGLEEGLAAGYLDRVCRSDSDWDISHAVWIKLLRRVLRRSKAAAL